MWEKIKRFFAKKEKQIVIEGEFKPAKKKRGRPKKSKSNEKA